LFCGLRFEGLIDIENDGEQMCPEISLMHLAHILSIVSQQRFR